VFTAAALSVLVMMLVLDTTLYSLMLIAEQIVHGLHWVEGTDWYLLRILIFYFFFYAAKLHKKMICNKFFG
jgi:hypothetical protein